MSFLDYVVVIDYRSVSRRILKQHTKHVGTDFIGEGVTDTNLDSPNAGARLHDVDGLRMA